jgi:hypothetical protein
VTVPTGTVAAYKAALTGKGVSSGTCTITDAADGGLTRIPYNPALFEKDVKV